MAQFRIMVSRHSAFYSPLISTIAGGFLQEEGFEPTYDVAGQPAVGALQNGDVEVCQAAVSASWPFLERGETPPVVHFAQINERDGFFVAAREPDANFSWSKLAGKEALVDHGGQPNAMFRYACHRTGVDYDSIKAIDAGSPDDIYQAFRNGQGQYVHLQGPAPQQLEHDGIGHVVASVGEAIGPVAFSSLMTTPEFLKKDEAKAFMRAYRKSRDWVINSPAEEIAAKEASFFPDIDQRVLANTIRTYQGLGCWNPSIEISRESTATALDVFLHSNLITKRHPYEQVVVPAPDA